MPDTNDKLYSLILMETGAHHARTSARRGTVLAGLAFLAGYLLSSVNTTVGVAVVAFGPLLLSYAYWAWCHLVLLSVRKKVESLPLWERHTHTLMFKRLGEALSSKEVMS